MNFVIDGAVLVLVFATGALVGVNNVPTVDKAIAAIKAAEAKAASTLAQITAHKATPAPVVVTTTTTAP